VIDDATLLRCFAPLEGSDGIALAVSGGADSLALMLLARRWAALTNGAPRIVVLTVDHGLRPEAAAEAAEVARIAGTIGFPAHILRWDGPYPDAGIEAAARDARYRLLFSAMAEERLTHCATAHHRDDQAETVLMRLARGSGVYGLAGMARQSARGDAVLVRPLLDLARGDLLAIVTAAGLVPVDDPHNRDPRFARARMRALMPVLAREGMTAERLAATASRLRRAAAALDHYVDRLLAAAASVDQFGAIRLSRPLWLAEPEEIRLRALARILRAAGGAVHVPRIERLTALAAVLAGDDPVRRTLAGAVASRRADRIVFEREAGRAGLPSVALVGGFRGVWDGRFEVEIDAEAPGLMLSALGEAGRLALPRPVRAGLPRTVATTPALFRDGHLVAAPLAGFTAGEHAMRASQGVARRLGEAVTADEA